MVNVPGGRVTETKGSNKTTGSNNVPTLPAELSGGLTKNPALSAAYDNTDAPYNHDANDVSGYIGVSSEYRTYADARNKPTVVAGEAPVFLSGEDEGGGPMLAESGSLLTEEDGGGEPVALVDRFSKEDLQQMSADRGLRTTGNKEELAQRIEEHDAEQAKGTPPPPAPPALS